MKKTLAIMMVLVLAMGMVFAGAETPAPVPTYKENSRSEATFTLTTKPATAKVKIGLTTEYLEEALKTKLDGFTKDPANFLDENRWDSVLPAVGAVSVPLDELSNDGTHSVFGSTGTNLFLWCVTRNADAQVSLKATPLVYDGETTAELKKIPYTLAYGAMGSIKMGAADTEAKEVILETGFKTKGAYNFMCSLTMTTDSVENAKLAQTGDYKATVSGIVSVK